jgi:Flp pilus assembly protein protease CpaA
MSIFYFLFWRACLYVSWKVTDRLNSVFWGYSVFWLPPGSVLYLHNFNVYIDWERILLEIVVITAIAAGVYALAIILKREKKSKNK